MGHYECYYGITYNEQTKCYDGFVRGGSCLKGLRESFEGIIRCSFWLSILVNRIPEYVQKVDPQLFLFSIYPPFRVFWPFNPRWSILCKVFKKQTLGYSPSQFTRLSAHRVLRERLWRHAPESPEMGDRLGRTSARTV
jgi:hypothetical protein